MEEQVWASRSISLGNHADVAWWSYYLVSSTLCLLMGLCLINLWLLSEGCSSLDSTEHCAWALCAMAHRPCLSLLGWLAHMSFSFAHIFLVGQPFFFVTCLSFSAHVTCSYWHTLTLVTCIVRKYSIYEPFISALNPPVVGHRYGEWILSSGICDNSCHLFYARMFFMSQWWLSRQWCTFVSHRLRTVCGTTCAHAQLMWHSRVVLACEMLDCEFSCLLQQSSILLWWVCENSMAVKCSLRVLHT